jgi:hypothetical protein
MPRSFGGRAEQSRESGIFFRLTLMPTSDPNQKMEDLLRAYAKKRRAEAGPLPELTPEVRARLHEEIQRKAGPAVLPSRPPWGWAMPWWVRLALGGAFAAVVLAVVWPKAPVNFKNASLGQETKTVPATKDLLGAEDQTKKVTPSMAVPTAPTVAPIASATTLADGVAMPPAQAIPPAATPAAPGSSIAATPTTIVPPAVAPSAPGSPTNESLATRTNNTANEMASATTAPGDGFGGGGGGLAGAGRGGRRGGSGAGGGGGGGRRAPGGGGAVATPTTTPPDNTLAAMDKLTTPGTAGDATPATRAVATATTPPERITYALKNTAAAPSAVLSAFQIERTGEQIRLIDADGSVYQGQISDQMVLEKMAQNGNVATFNSANAAQFPQANTKAPTPSLLGGFSFRVSGQNRTLNQNITCSGDFFSTPLKQYANAFKNNGGESQSNGATQPQNANNAQVLDNSQNNFNTANYNNQQQNGFNTAQVWQVTGQVRIGLSNQFDLNAVTIQP